MNESFLHYVWQLVYFDTSNLLTTEGEKLQIIKQGNHNGNAGPDFLQAKIYIGAIQWVGSVEIHIKSSDWISHKHQTDLAYDNVVLHVVWENDKQIRHADGTCIPTLELKGRVDQKLIQNYRNLVNSPLAIACEKSIQQVNSILTLSMIEQATMRRVEAKSGEVISLVNANNGDWDETTYQWLAKNFGFKVNTDTFFQLAKSLPYKLVRKHINSQLQIEALLFGQAGMLPTKTKNDYITSLFAEYNFLRSKYSLEPTINSAQWKFLRLRPANFPTLRIAQLASLLHSTQGLFSKISEGSVSDLLSLFDAAPSHYWQSHYHFSKPSASGAHALGKSSKEILLINGIVPILIAYGKLVGDQHQIERAVELLQQLPAEKNKLISYWKQIGVEAKSAFDTQGLIEQHNQMCLKRQCLNCVVGTTLVKS